MEASSDAPGRILLLSGGELGAALELLRAITHPLPLPALSPAPASHPWRLDTKYYTAEVLFDLRHVDQCGEVQLGEGAYEAVLMVFDAAQRASFDSLQRWWEAAGGGDADLAVRLAVSTGLCSSDDAAGEPARSSWVLEVEDWCAEQLVEYVEVAPASEEQPQPAAQEAATAAASAGSDGHGRVWEEATGVERIREALHAHMWPGMQLKPSPRHGAAAAAAATDAASEQGSSGDEEDVEDAIPASANGAPLANGHGSTSAAAGAAGGAAEAAGGAGGAAEDFSLAHYLRSPAEAAAAAGAAGEGEEQEEVEQLERLFAQVASHREQLAQLPDAQRREAAATMVMQLMAAMGMDEDDEGGEDDEDDDE